MVRCRVDAFFVANDHVLGEEDQKRSRPRAERHNAPAVGCRRRTVPDAPAVRRPASPAPGHPTHSDHETKSGPRPERSRMARANLECIQDLTSVLSERGTARVRGDRTQIARHGAMPPTDAVRLGGAAMAEFSKSYEHLSPEILPRRDPYFFHNIRVQHYSIIVDILTVALYDAMAHATTWNGDLR